MKKPPSKRAIAFSAEFLDEDGLRNARMALADPTTPPTLRAELERYLEHPLKAATADLQQLLDERAQLRGGRTSGKDRDAAERVRRHIRDLRALYPTASAKKLRSHVDTDIVPRETEGGMSIRRWDNLVSEVAPRRPRKRRAR